MESSLSITRTKILQKNGSVVGTSFLFSFCSSSFRGMGSGVEFDENGQGKVIFLKNSVCRVVSFSSATVTF